MLSKLRHMRCLSKEDGFVNQAKGTDDRQGHKSMTSHNNLDVNSRLRANLIDVSDCEQHVHTELKIVGQRKRQRSSSGVEVQRKATNGNLIIGLSRKLPNRDTNSVQREQRRRYANTRNLAPPCKRATRVTQKPKC